MSPPSGLAGQHYQVQVQHYGVENGLSHREVETVFQDHDGFIWLGTRFGLNRFDGYTFQSWTLAQFGVNFNDISRICQDDAGWLWLFNGDREFIFLHPHTGEIRTMRERFGEGFPFPPSAVFWSGDGKMPSTDATGRLHFVTVHPDLAYSYSTAEGFRREAFPDPVHTGLWPDSLKSYYNKVQQSTWRLQTDGWHITDANGRLQLRLLRSDYPPDFFDRKCIYTDSQGHVWVGSNFGVYLVNVQATHFQRYFHFIRPRDKPFSNSARGIWVHGNTIFANFERGGFVKIDRTHQGWTLLDRTSDRHDPPIPESFGYWGRPLLRDVDGGFWIGTDRSLHHLDSTGRLLERFGFDQRQTVVEGLADLWAIYRNGDRLWLGTAKGLAYKDRGDPFMRFYAGLPRKGEQQWLSVVHITADRDSNLWLCTNQGLFALDAARQKVQRYGSRETGRHWLPSGNFQFLYQDPAGYYWLATAGNGLLRWDRRTGEVRRLIHVDGLSNDNIYAIYEDAHRHLWLSSDYGIMQVDKTSLQVRTYLPKDGLTQEEFNKTAHFQAVDGSIFFGGLNGITAFQPEDFYADSAVAVTTPLCITSFQQFDPERHQLVDHTADLLRERMIRIEADDRFFQVEFALLAYENAEKIRYAWKIEGLDADWNYQQERSLRLSRLPFGTHTLRIKAQTANGQWSSQELALTVVVIRPFYLSPYFYLLIVAGLLAGSYASYTWRLRRLQQRQALMKTAIELATTQIQQDKALIEHQAGELRQLDQMKSRFFVNISHELRTPLTLISGPAEHLLRHQETMTPAQRATLLRHLLQNSGKLLNLVEELLELSRLDARQVELDKQPVDFTAFTRRIFSAFEAKAQLKRLEYTLDDRLGAPCWLLLDPGRVEKILNNLLANALQYTPAGGRVGLEMSRQDQSIVVQVRDTGAGIHPDDLPHVFDRYFQSRQRDRRDGGAAGIGLALARELAGLMNGQLSATSQWGMGSVFTFTFPEEPVAPPARPPVEKSTRSAPAALPAPEIAEAGNAPTILVVEDNADLRDYLRLVLEPTFHVMTADDGRQAWRLLESDEAQQVQLVLSDVMMPEMDGFELLAHIKGHPYRRTLPVVLLTARSDGADRLQGLRLGVDDYLIKPFSTAELLARLHNLIGRYRERQEVLKRVPGGGGEPNVSISSDDRWLEQLQAAVREALNRPDGLSVPALAERMLMSPRNFQRKIRQLTGLTPNQYITECRLDRARQLLENRVYGTVREVAFAVGFDTPHYFSSVYLQRFGRTPASYWE